MLNDYIALDLETTGFSPTANEIIEIGAWKVKDGVVKDKFCTYVRPYGYIPRNIQQLTGINMKTVKDAPVIDEIIYDFFEWCEDYPFVAHNLKFDYSFIVNKGENFGIDFTLNEERKGLDTLTIARRNLRLPNNKLGTLVEHFNITLEGNLHGARTDSYAVKLIIDRFNQMMSSIEMTPQCLHNKNEVVEHGVASNNAILSFK